MTRTSTTKKTRPAPKDHIEQKFKKMGSEIDDIFAGKKRKKLEKETAKIKKLVKDAAAKAEPHNEVKIKKMSKNRIPEENLFAETPSWSRRKTGYGLAIYREDELGIGKPDAGGTRLCPFDCDCCF